MSAAPTYHPVLTWLCTTCANTGSVDHAVSATVDQVWALVMEDHARKCPACWKPMLYVHQEPGRIPE